MILMESMNNFIIKFYEELLCDKDLQFSEKGFYKKMCCSHAMNSFKMFIFAKHQLVSN